MKESYGKGLANRPGPESCAGIRKEAGEALTGAHAGQPLSSEITLIGVPTSSPEGEGHRKADAKREPADHAAESQTLSMREHSMRENRETPSTPSADGGEGRREKAFCQASRVHVLGESDDLIVPTKRANKVGP